MGSFQLTVTSHRTKPKHFTMSSTLISSLLLSNMAASTMASVAVGLGQINPANPSECIDPATGISHPLGSSWGVAGCGQASCDLRQGTVFMSYSYCGATGTAEQGCYIKQDTQLAYPYCCPRSFCPTKTTNFFEDIISNSIDMVLGGGDSDVEELQMAAANVPGNQAGVNVVQYEVDMNRDSQDYGNYDWDRIFAEYGSSF